MLRTIALALAVSFPLCLSAVAQEGGGVVRPSGPPAVRALHGAEEARDWHAVGRIDTGVSFCTGALIAPDLVLTAAHCLFTPEGRRLADGDLTFSAGLRNGRAEAIRTVTRSFLPAGYTRPVGRADMASIAQDVALLRLDRPVAGTAVRPLATGASPRALSAVALVSYGADRATYPSIEENCRILSRQRTVQVLSCHVVSGSSGAPVLRVGADGPEIVGVVSGRSDVLGNEVTVAVAAEGLVADLLRVAMASPPVRPPPRVSQGGSIIIRRVGEDSAAREGLGARFVRP